MVLSVSIGTEHKKVAEVEKKVLEVQASPIKEQHITIQEQSVPTKDQVQEQLQNQEKTQKKISIDTDNNTSSPQKPGLTKNKSEKSDK